MNLTLAGKDLSLTFLKGMVGWKPDGKVEQNLCNFNIADSRSLLPKTTSKVRLLGEGVRLYCVKQDVRALLLFRLKTSSAKGGLGRFTQSPGIYLISDRGVDLLVGIPIS